MTRNASDFTIIFMGAFMVVLGVAMVHDLIVYADKIDWYSSALWVVVAHPLALGLLYLLKPELPAGKSKADLPWPD